MQKLSNIGNAIHMSTDRGHRDGNRDESGEGGERELELHCGSVG